MNDTKGPGKEFELKVLGHRVCAKAYALAKGVSERTLARKKSVIREEGGILPVDVQHGNLGRVRPTDPARECVTWLKNFFEEVSQFFPNQTVRDPKTGLEMPKEFLSGIFRTVDSVYRYYECRCLSRGKSAVSFSTFRRIWKDRFFQVSTARRDAWDVGYLDKYSPASALTHSTVTVSKKR